MPGAAHQLAMLGEETVLAMHVVLVACWVASLTLGLVAAVRGLVGGGE